MEWHTTFKTVVLATLFAFEFEIIVAVKEKYVFAANSWTARHVLVEQGRIIDLSLVQFVLHLTRQDI